MPKGSRGRAGRALRAYLPKEGKASSYKSLILETVEVLGNMKGHYATSPSMYDEIAEIQGKLMEEVDRQLAKGDK